jgi:Ca2+:H+ antiporter
MPIWAWATPVAGCLLLLGTWTGLAPSSSMVVLLAAAALLVAAVFASVHHAEILAHRLGEPFGSIVLAVAVTVIEVALIVSIMLAAKEGSDVLARDTVYATVMIVLNGIVGLCLTLGSLRHYEQSFSTDAATAALSVLVPLAVITLVLPNYSIATPGPVYSSAQLIFVGIVSAILYCVFLFIQTVRHPVYFVMQADADDNGGHAGPRPSARRAWAGFALLGLALMAVVLLAKTLSPSLEDAVAAAGLPKAFVGVLIAGVVLLPEGLAAVRADCEIEARLQSVGGGGLGHGSVFPRRRALPDLRGARKFGVRPTPYGAWRRGKTPASGGPSLMVPASVAKCRAIVVLMRRFDWR